jgi:glucose/arabinose dehydrogenase
MKMQKLLILSMLLYSSLIHAQTLALQQVASGFSSPVEMVHAGDGRLFVVQQRGLIRILDPTTGAINATPFLDLTGIVNQSGGEKGLLGLAFSPNYATDGTFFVSYTRALSPAVSGVDCLSVIAKYTVSTNPNVANTTGTEIFSIQQNLSNHNGGCIRFGPDNLLYYAVGDGGGAGDTGNRSQNISTNLGKLHRLNVLGTSTYTIPAGNPFVGITGNDEIWAYGLRNPWKFCFDNNNIIIADVGQGNWEEVNIQPYTTAGLNYGWRCKEGNADYNTSPPCTGTLTAPNVVISHSAPNNYCSITGGYVYRGTQYPNMVGKYIFGDYCDTKLGITNIATGVTTYTSSLGSYNISSFGEDNNKNLYLVDLGGTIYKITDTTLSNDSFANSNFKIYPNPVKNILSLENTNNENITDIAIYNTNGQLVYQKNNINQTNTDINTEKLAQGIYFMQITNSQNSVLNYKFIKE